MDIIHKPRHKWSFEVLQKSSTTGKACIIKRIPAAVNPLLRPLLKWFLKREACILKEIRAKIRGITPDLYWVGKDEFVMEKLTGPNLWQIHHELKKRQDIFNKLEHVIQKLHGCGFSHGEIRLGNIVFNADDIVLVDLAMAFRQNNFFFKLIKKLDLLSLLWIKKNVFALPLTDNESNLLKRYFLIRLFFDWAIARDIIYP